MRCFMYTFPDRPVVRNYKTKEFAVVEEIKKDFPDMTWVDDKPIKDGCSNKRPDLLLDLGYQVLNVEIDENSHTNYDITCENKRLMQISSDIGHRPLIVLRFNPDDYINEKGHNIKSCWKVGKDGIIRISKETECNSRLKTLKEEIQYWLTNNSEKTLHIKHLFYNY